MKTVAFNPCRSPIESLFAKWVPLYIGQCPLDDKEAEKYQAPLADLESAILPTLKARFGLTDADAAEAISLAGHYSICRRPFG